MTLEVDDERLDELYKRFSEMVEAVEKWNMDDPQHDVALNHNQIVSLMISSYRMAEADGEDR